MLEAAKSESKKTMLVYASEKAMNHPIQALPKKLEVNIHASCKSMLTPRQTFVKWENTNFKSEFRAVEDAPVGTHTIIDDTQPVGLSSPGKRKFHESSLYNQDYGVKVSERELPVLDASSEQNAGHSSGTLSAPGSPKETEEVLVGIDPSLLSKEPVGDRDMEDFADVPLTKLSREESLSFEREAGEEMQQRPSGPMLTRRIRPTKEKPSTIDSMDLDRVLEDANVKEESAAVKHVGFVE